MTSFYQSINSNNDDFINSTCADIISVNPLTGTVAVIFKNGAVYGYTNVSRRAILMFMADKARSLGKFVNTVLTEQRVKCVSPVYG